MSDLDDSINTAAAAILTRINTLVSSGNITDLTLASKALEALRGTSALQNIIQQADGLSAALNGTLSTAQSALTSSKDTYLAALTSLKDTLSGNLTDLETTLMANYLSGANAIGAPRIGDIFLSIYPDPTLLPADVKLCDGNYLPLADAGYLINAWGLGSGQTPVPFVTNYNAGAGGATIIVDGTGLRLPNLSGAFFKAGAASQVGTYQADQVGGHTHSAGTASFVVSATGTGSGVNAAGGASFRLGTQAATADNAPGAETRPKNFSALALVRYK